MSGQPTPRTTSFPSRSPRMRRCWNRSLRTTPPRRSATANGSRYVRPVQARIDAAKRRLSRISPTHRIEDYAGQSGLLRDAWADLPLTRQSAIVRTVLDHVVVNPAITGRNTFDPTRFDSGLAALRGRGRRAAVPPPRSPPSVTVTGRPCSAVDVLNPAATTSGSGSSSPLQPHRRRSPPALLGDRPPHIGGGRSPIRSAACPITSASVGPVMAPTSVGSPARRRNGSAHRHR